MKQKVLFIIVSLIVSRETLTRNCFTSMHDELSISADCDEISIDSDILSKSSTFISPRSITSDLTYRNCVTFFNRFHDDPSCYFFTWESQIIMQQTRKSVSIGRGFLGQNPLLVAQFGAPLNSLNIGLSSSQPEGFLSTVRLGPKRKLIAWMPQFMFNLENFCDCLWADVAFAVVHATHEISLFEQVITFSDDPNRVTVKQALNELDTFPASRSHTGVDDIEIRLGYTVQYCEDDMFALYAFAGIPTRRTFDNSRWFQPLVGSKAGALGAGILFDSTMWYSEFEETECMLLSELKFKYTLSYDDLRIFDLKNGPLSRFLRLAPQNDPTAPQSATNFLRKCVTIEARHSVDWWIALHYKYCQWGFEVGYNLWYEQQERIRPTGFDFGEFGIFDMTRITNLTSHSTALISDGPGEGIPDPSFVTLTSSDVNICSAQAHASLSHTFSGALTYCTHWDEKPITFSLGGRYEAAGEKKHTSTLESWGLFYKFSITF